MLARQMALLNPLEATLPECLLFVHHTVLLNLLKSTLANCSQHIENTDTLNPAESALTRHALLTPLVSTLTKNGGGGGPDRGTDPAIATHHSPLVARHSRHSSLTPLVTRHSERTP